MSGRRAYASPSMTADVLVVGGGIGGLASALAIARGGLTVHLLEQAPEFSEVGAGLQLGPNALRAFDELGVYNEIARTAVFPARALVRHAVTAEVLTTLEFGPSFERRYGYPYVVAHRSDVLAALLNACRAEPCIALETNSKVVDVRQDGDSATVVLADGSTRRAPILVGADGIRSRVRHLIDDRPPVFSGHVAYRGALPLSQLPEPPDLDSVLLWIGPRMHLMQYPVRSGEMYNQVAVYERPGGHTEATGTTEELTEAFLPACDAVTRSLSLIDTSSPWPIWDRDPLDSWHVGRAVLIGDAAHAMLQYLGQGACQALEDAVTLGKALKDSPADVAGAFASYQGARRPVAARCQAVARPWGEVWHSRDPVIVALRDRVFRARRPDDYTELDWLYASRHDAPAPTRPQRASEPVTALSSFQQSEDTP